MKILIKCSGVFLWLWVTIFFILTHFHGEPWDECTFNAFYIGWCGIGFSLLAGVGVAIGSEFCKDFNIK